MVQNDAKIRGAMGYGLWALRCGDETLDQGSNGVRAFNLGTVKRPIQDFKPGAGEHPAD